MVPTAPGTAHRVRTEPKGTPDQTASHLRRRVYSDTGSQSCSSDHLRHLVAHWWHERLRTALAGGRRRGLAGHRVGAEMTFQVIGSVRCRPAGRPLVEASEVGELERIRTGPTIDVRGICPCDPRRTLP